MVIFHSYFKSPKGTKQTWPVVVHIHFRSMTVQSLAAYRYPQIHCLIIIWLNGPLLGTSMLRHTHICHISYQFISSLFIIDCMFQSNIPYHILIRSLQYDLYSWVKSTCFVVVDSISIHDHIHHLLPSNSIAQASTGEDDRPDADLGIQLTCRGFGSSRWHNMT